VKPRTTIKNTSISDFTAKCKTKSVGKISDTLGIVFETATALKAAFYTPLNSQSPNFSEAKAFMTSFLRSVYYTEEYALFRSPLPQD